MDKVQKHSSFNTLTSTFAVCNLSHKMTRTLVTDITNTNRLSPTLRITFTSP